MASRLITAGLCAVGFGALGAGTAGAHTPSIMYPYADPPARVQLWNANGLSGTIECPAPAADPVCDPDTYPGSLDRHTSVPDNIGYRLIHPAGVWVQAGGTDATFAAMEAADRSGGPGAVVNPPWQQMPAQVPVGPAADEIARDNAARNPSAGAAKRGMKHGKKGKKGAKGKKGSVKQGGAKPKAKL